MIKAEKTEQKDTNNIILKIGDIVIDEQGIYFEVIFVEGLNRAMLDDENSKLFELDDFAVSLVNER